MRKHNAVKTALSISGSEQRIVLHYWATDPQPRLQNIARVDTNGQVIWRAALPGDASRDCFVHLERRGDAFVARTWSGQECVFDEHGRTCAA